MTDRSRRLAAAASVLFAFAVAACGTSEPPGWTYSPVATPTGGPAGSPAGTAGPTEPAITPGATPASSPSPGSSAPASVVPATPGSS